MINLTFDLSTDIARLAQATVIKLGADIPIRLTFTTSPSDISSIQLGVGSDGASPTLLAYTEEFVLENSTTWSALLNANDSRLVAHVAGQTSTSVNLELVCLIDGRRRISPNLPVSVQPPIIPSLATVEGGPSYYTAAQTNAAIASAISPLARRSITGKYRFKSDGSLQLWNPDQSKWQSLTLSGGAGAELISINTGENP